MIVQCDCPYCKKTGFASISVGFEEQSFLDENEMKNYVLENITVTKTDMVEEIVRMVKPHLKPGMSISEHFDILKNAFGISEKCCRALISRLLADRTRI